MGRRSPDNQIDWELVEREYRLGQKSLRQMAAEFKVQASAISRRAKKDGWVQDKSHEVRAISENQLLLSNTRKATEKATPDRVDIEAAAEVRTNLILSHRQDIGRSRSLFRRLMDELDLETDNRALFEQLGELLDESGLSRDGRMVRDQLNEIYRKVISTPGRVDSAKKLVEILEKVVRLEREAFGVDSAEDKKQTAIDNLLREINEAP